MIDVNFMLIFFVRNVYFSSISSLLIKQIIARYQPLNHIQTGYNLHHNTRSRMINDWVKIIFLIIEYYNFIKYKFNQRIRKIKIRDISFLLEENVTLNVIYLMICN